MGPLGTAAPWFRLSFPVQPVRHRQALFPQEGGIEQLALIAHAAVAEDRHDGMAGPELAGEPQRAGHVHAARGAEAEPLLLEQVEHQRDRLFVRSEEHTSELPSIMRISYAVICLKQKK